MMDAERDERQRPKRGDVLGSSHQTELGWCCLELAAAPLLGATTDHQPQLLERWKRLHQRPALGYTTTKLGDRP